jgi:hypothetical protein
MQTNIDLHKLADDLIISLLANTTKQRSFIVNDIHRELRVSADRGILSSVLSTLLYDTVAHTSDNCIHISAKAFGYITLIHIRNNNGDYDKAISVSLNQVQSLAEKLGGCIGITNNRLNGTTVALTFVSQAKIA